MKSRLAFLLRVLVAAAGLVWAFTTAIGSGVNDVLTILGVKLNAAQQVFAGALVFGTVLLIDNLSLRQRLASHVEAPNLLWQGVRVEPANRGEGFALTVACKNDGPTARIDRASEVFASYSYSFMPDTPPESVTISWGDFDEGGYIETGVFDLVMTCPKAAEGADHKVTWRVVYWDPHMRAGYVSECWAVVRFVMDKPSVVRPSHLDPTLARGAAPEVPA